ncbi:TAXI family TRAP transporter solute-binding subunit [Sedimentibacter sp.]|uniref:TAXI family TRAP transporter solute-binding subunit n=2 Tax=Sedimentibacter sp. TaxID=1960295 RepID=UPI0028A67A48|nr:TAXI family TRAP transporter solute-binding subunit [Sedimentibacter sp.]
MKKRISVLLVIALLMTIVMAACSTPQTNLILATGGTTGTYYPFGGAMANIFNTKIENMNVTAQATGASVENCKLLGKNEAELAILQNDMLDYAYNGTEAFAEGKLENLRGIAKLYPEIIQIVAAEGINGIEDLKGKKVSVGAPGSGVEANARQILEAYGMTYDDMSVSYLSFAESADAYKDKHIDAFFVTSGIPNSSIQDIAAMNPVSLVSLSDNAIGTLVEKYPFFVEYTIPSNTYNGQSSDVKTAAVLACLATNSEASEDIIYDITKSLFENQPELATAHAKGAELKLDEAVDGISIPLHPGAEKYFKETGILK